MPMSVILTKRDKFRLAGHVPQETEQSLQEEEVIEMRDGSQAGSAQRCLRLVALLVALCSDTQSHQSDFSITQD